MKFYHYTAVCTNVVDGDTIDVTIDVGFKMTTTQRVRLIDIDTPERGQDGYYDSKEFVAERIMDKKVGLVTHKSDAFGRYLAEVFVPLVDDFEEVYSLNELLLHNALAVPYIK